MLDPEASASFADDQQELGGKALDFRTTVTAGEHWVAASIPRLYEGLPASYNGPNPSRRPAFVWPEFKPPRRDPTPERIAEALKRYEENRARVRPAGDARVGYMEIGGPYTQTTGPSAESRAKIFVCGHPRGSHVAGCATPHRRLAGRRARFGVRCRRRGGPLHGALPPGAAARRVV